jgi:hypothetical protein
MTAKHVHKWGLWESNGMGYEYRYCKCGSFQARPKKVA